MEPTERVVASAVSLGKAADTLNDPLYYIPWLNFTADPRREQGEIARAKKKAKDMENAIQDSLKGFNIVPNTAFDHLPYGTTIAGIRQRMLLGALGIFVKGADSPLKVDHIIRRPYLSVDADTTISENALVTIKESLELDHALFVSGNLRYVGGIMDKDIGTIKQEPKEMRLLYAVELMRRQMLNSLPPTWRRGYLPETGMATTLSVLASLGGFNVHSKDNESYWLEAAAEKATKDRLKSHQRRSRRPLTQREIDAQRPALLIADFYGLSLESITRYENYSIDTSVEGIESQVRKHGAAATVAFDQGSDYAMRTQFEQQASSGTGHSRPDFPTHLILNAAYSYYKLCGGELTVEGQLALNELINDLRLVESDELTPGQLAWVPQYLAKEEWPTAL
jgi:hypothetical protein